MCKLFCVLDIENQNEAERFIKKAVPFVTKSDNHGLGLMRLGEKGVYIQRWLDIPKRLITNPNVSTPYKEMLRLESNEAGKRSQKLDAIALHGRMATCGISLENTHPFYLNGSALMHNGIISNVQPEDNVISSCDSEVLLHRYRDYEVYDHPVNLTDALKDVTGYYASIVFNDNGIVDIWRDDQAELVLAHVQGVGNVIATNADLIYRTARACQKRVTFCYPVLSFTHLRWQKGKRPKMLSFTKPFVTAVYGAKECQADIDRMDRELDMKSERWRDTWPNREEAEYLEHLKGV